MNGGEKHIRGGAGGFGSAAFRAHYIARPEDIKNPGIDLGRSGASPHQRMVPNGSALPLLQHLPQERRGPANLALRYFFR
jgi:hypothetical protein